MTASLDGDAALVGRDEAGGEPQQVVLPHPLGPSSVMSSPLRTVDEVERHHQLGRSFWPGRTRTGKNLLTPS